MCLVVAFRKAKVTGWRRHLHLIGRPDFTFPAERVVVFVDGDFWHGNPKKFKLPSSNSAFWEEKIKYNRAKDRRVTRYLRKSGWTVIRIWESSLKRNCDACVGRIIRARKKFKKQ